MFRYILLSCLFLGLHPALLASSTQNINKIDLALVHIILSFLILLIMFPFNYTRILNYFKNNRTNPIYKKKYFYGFLAAIMTNIFIIYDIFAFSKLGINTYLYVTLFYCFTILFSAFIISKSLNKKINLKSYLSIFLVILGICGVLQG